MIAVTTDVIATEARNILQVYRRNPIVFERGEGCRLYTSEGVGYLDLISGVGVAALGHARLQAGRADDATTLVPLYLRAPAIGPQRQG